MATTEEFKLSDEARKVIDNLRGDVATQKDCITRYTVMSIGFVGVGWGLISKIDGFGLPFYCCGALMVFMLLVVVRLSSHKYATINRQLGYELHLNRLIDYARSGNQDWAKRMMDVHWEEAMCAWRFVQPTIFDKVYKPLPGKDGKASDDGYDESFRPYIRNPEHCAAKHKIKQDQHINGTKAAAESEEDVYYWYETEALMPDGATYHQGKYLQNIQRFLHTVAGFTITSMWGLLIYQFADYVLPNIHLHDPHSTGKHLYSLWQNGFCFVLPDTKQAFVLAVLKFTAAGGILVLISRYGWTQVRRQSGHREILEGGMLSIQTCAMVWRIVITCHILGSYWPLSHKHGYRHYTTYTSAMGLHFVQNGFYRPHDWLKKWEDAFGFERLEAELEPVFSLAKPREFHRKYLKPGEPKTLQNVLAKISHMFKRKD